MSEQEYMDRLERFLFSHGCTVWQHQVPLECKGWPHPWEADMIIYHQNFGYIGVEGKMLSTIRQGSVIYRGIEQLKKYKPLHYIEGIGIRIEKWALVFGLDCTVMEYGESQTVRVFLQTFLMEQGLHFIEFDETICYIDRNNPKSIQIPFREQDTGGYYDKYSVTTT